MAEAAVAQLSFLFFGEEVFSRLSCRKSVSNISGPPQIRHE